MFDIFDLYDTVRRYVSRNDLLLTFSLVVGYFVTRLARLEYFPIFSDEAIYIHWAKIAWHDASWRFISLTDGKQPLQTWGTIPFLKFFPDNLLVGGRLFSVATGFIALIGIATLLYYLWGKRAAFFGALLYILTPYFLFYDRMALVDSGVNAAVIWLLFLSMLLATNRTVGLAVIYGVVGGIALLSKSSMRIFIGLSAFAPILFFEKNTKRFLQNATNFYLLLGLGAFISLIIYNIQRLSPFFHNVAEKNTTFIMTLSEFREDPFAVFPRNITLIPYYVFSESGYILCFFGLAGLYYLYKKQKHLAIYISLWIAIPFAIVSFVSKVLFPRYIIFFPTLLLIGATYLFVHHKRKQLVIGLLTIFLLSVSYFDYTLLFDYKNVPFPDVDRGQYIQGWPAGIGMREIVNYLVDRSHEKKVMVITEGNFGMAGDVVDTLLPRNADVTIQAYWPLEQKNLKENQNKVGEYEVYVVTGHRLSYPDSWPAKLVKRFDKPGSESALLLLKLEK